MSALNLRLVLTIILTLVLSIIPLPELLAGFRPPWVLILVLYLQFFIPEYFNLLLILILGLALDVLLSTVLGEHAFALSFITWIASSKDRRFRLFSISQQMVLFGFFCLLYQMLILTIDASLGHYYSFIPPLGSTLISILLWPWVRLFADEKLGCNLG
jgi:rod shape-determining protein MreD